MSLTTDPAEQAPYLDVADPNFSIRSKEVEEAREKSWYARTPYGIAVLRYEDVNSLVRDRRLRQGSYAWPAHNKAQGSFSDWWVRMLLSKEGADHSRLRRLAKRHDRPFGGIKQSGNGHDKSLHVFGKYTELKATWIKL